MDSNKNFDSKRTPEKKAHLNMIVFQQELELEFLNKPNTVLYVTI